MRVAFLGNCADYSLPFLETLVERTHKPTDSMGGTAPALRGGASVKLVAVICPQRFASRKAELTFAAKRGVGRALERLPPLLREQAARLQSGRASPGPWTRMQQLALAVDAPVFWPGSVGDPETVERVVALRPDIAIVAGLNQILREKLLAAFPPVFNFHPSLLPENRGGLPEFWLLDSGAREGGVTAHRIERGVDTGPIVAQCRVPIEPWLDAEGLITRCSHAGAKLLDTFLDGYPQSAAAARPQAGGSYQPFPTEQDRVVPFDRPASGVFNRARAFGWSAPLVMHVPREAWEARTPVQVGSGAESSSAVVHLYDPIAFDSHGEGQPGRFLRTAEGPVSVTCNPGTVLFRRAELGGKP